MPHNDTGMYVSNDTEDKIELFADGVIFVERPGHRTERELRYVFNQIKLCAYELREQAKPVLILNRAHGSSVNPHILILLLDLDFDKIAVFGTSKRVDSLRDLMTRANGLEGKIASFQSENDALVWLHTS